MHMKKLLIILICLLSGLALYGQEAIFIGAASIADPFFTDTVYFDYDSVYISNGGDTMKFVVDDVEGLRIVNTGSDSRVYIYGDLVVDSVDADYIDTDTLLVNNFVIISPLATPTTTVLTPTSTGLIDTLETTDLATADFTVTGDWTFNLIIADSIDANYVDTDTLLVNDLATMNLLVVDSIDANYINTDTLIANDTLYVGGMSMFDSTVSIGGWGYTGEHIVIPETSSNTNPLLGIYGTVNYAATANKVFAGTYSRLLAMTENQANSSTMVGTESQFRLRDVDIANGVHAGIWAYAEQSGTSALSGTGTFDAISACVESEEHFTVGATAHVTGITVDASIHASATIDASANYSGLYIKSNGKD